MSFRITVDDAELKRVKDRLGELEHKAPNVIANALNRAVSNVKANLPKEATKIYYIKNSKVKETLKEFKASQSRLEAGVRAKGKVIGLNHFKVSPKTVNPRRKSQLKIAIIKNGLKQIPGAFNANINGVKVFTRTGKFSIATKGSYKGRIVKRGPRKGKPLLREEIERKFGPSVPQMLDEEKIVENVNQDAYFTYEKRVNHEINRILSKMGAW